MAIDWNKVGDVLAIVAEAAAAVGPVVPEPAETILRFAAAAARLGADIAHSGLDPVEHIEKIHAAEPLLAGVDSAWRDALRAKFGEAPPPEPV